MKDKLRKAVEGACKKLRRDGIPCIGIMAVVVRGNGLSVVGAAYDEVEAAKLMMHLGKKAADNIEEYARENTGPDRLLIVIPKPGTN